MKLYKAQLIYSIVDINGFPDINLPEIAFTGRSNVGKSSLLNCLVQNQKLARISSTPGKTRQINFFLINDKWIFVDLPGFGYASVSKKERADWSKLNLYYLQNRVNLKLVFSLIDSRHEPTEIDLGLVELFENVGRNYVIVLTKTDKIPSKLLEQRIGQVSELTQNCKQMIDIIPHSSKTKIGTRDLMGVINRVVLNKM